MKNIKINSFVIDFNEPLSEFEYNHVRFDGCPNVNNRYLLSKIDYRKNSTLDKNPKRIEVIYEGNKRFAYDTVFNSFTEYFYRVIASDPFGATATSEWLLLRSPEGVPKDYVDLKYLNAQVVSGYQIKVLNMSNFCYYCDSMNRMNRIFNGIIHRFILVVEEFNSDLNQYDGLKNVTFYCDTVCFAELLPTKNAQVYDETIFSEDFDPNANVLLIETKPVTKYLLAVQICTEHGGCTISDFKPFTTNEEAPTGVAAPDATERTATSLRLTWKPPKNSNGNVTGYILRLIDSVNSENAIYFGLNLEYLYENLKSFTTYTFSLEACNRIGCSRSPQSSFTTSEMAPLSVMVPLVVNVDTSIKLKKKNFFKSN